MFLTEISYGVAWWKMTEELWEVEVVHVERNGLHFQEGVGVI
jgi:hypothetical protein